MASFTTSFAESMNRLGTETAFEVLAKAKALEAQGKHIIHLQIGEPDFDTPPNIVDAAIKALKEGWTHYGPVPGIPDLRKAIAQYISQTRSIPVEPDEVVVTPGGKPIIFYTMMVLLEPGDEVLCPNPAYPIYESMIHYAGAKSVPIPLLEEKDFRFDIAEIKKRISPKTKLIVLNSPANPTGGVLSKQDLQDIADIIRPYNCFVLSDEIYSRILYGETHHSFASIPGMKERTIILDGFSKTYSMTGWRAGYGVANPSVIKAISRLITNCNSCTTTFVQKACVEALQGPQDAVDRMIEEFRKRRDVFVAGLNSIKGISCRTPLGAFYVFPNISKTGMKSKAMSEYLLNEAGVATLCGTAFGQYGEGYLRFSYANSMQNIEIALERINKAVSHL